MAADDVRRAWDDLLAALADRAPVSRAAIRPPRPDVGARLDRAERDLELALGEDLRTFFALHHGAENPFDAWLFPDGVLVDVEWALRDSRTVLEAWVEADEQWGTTRPTSGVAGEIGGTRLREYVTYTVDTCGNGGFVDLRAGALHGCVRRWDKVDNDMADHHDGGPLATGLAELLTNVAEAIGTLGGYPGKDVTPPSEWLVRVVDGAVRWGAP